ncbi:MAG: hypothetical protein ACK5O2_16290 [Microthrixaceae bacterium]
MGDIDRSTKCVNLETGPHSWSEQLELFGEPPLWPHRPLLPVVRGDVESRDAVFEYGLAVEGGGPRVYLHNLVGALVALRDPDWESTWLSLLSFETYDSWEEVLRAGWTID